MYKLSTQCFVVTAILLSTSPMAYGQAMMPGAPVGSYTDYFKYYRPGAADMPPGSNLTSDAVVGMNRHYWNYDESRAETRSSTAFLIYTRRDDHKICMCTAGHNLTSLNANVGDVVSFDAYMKYLGKPWLQFPELNEPVAGYKTTLHAEILAKMNKEPATAYADAALLLVSESELPLQIPYLLGYSEEDLYNPQSSFYLIGHPHAMPQRVADNLIFTMGSPPLFTPSSALFQLSGTDNNAVGGGNSGSPVVYKGQGNFVTGIFDGPRDAVPTFIPDAETEVSDVRMQYSLNMYGTKIAALMPAIRKHCWNKRDSAAIATSQSYKQGITVANSAQVAKFLTDHLITLQAGIAAIADPTYSASNPGTKLLKANLLTINCPLTPGTDLPRLFGLAKEVRLDAGFSYTANGNYYMDMNTVVPEQAGTARTIAYGNTDTSQQTDAAGFSVYPNPGSSGLFYLSFPSNDDYSLKVFSTDGRLVYQAATMAGQNPYRFSLLGMPRGTYVLNLYKKKTGEQLLRKTIVYQ